MTISARIIIDGIEAYDDDDDLRQGYPTILDGAQFVWGRDTVVDQPTAGTGQFTLRQQITGQPGQQTLFDFLQMGATVEVRSTDSITGTDVAVWLGQITNASVVEVGPGLLQGSVSCTDPSATLANVSVGDEPWDQETAYDRFQHILDAAGLQMRNRQAEGGWSWTLTGDMDPSIQSIMVARRDIDKQPPLTLMQQLAETLGAVCWITADETGPYIWIEDPTQRPGLRQFYIQDDGLIGVRDAGTDLEGINLWPAIDVIRDPLTWTQDPTTGIKSVTVNWKHPATDDNGLPTSVDQTTVQIDRTRKNVSTMTVDTDLVTERDAGHLAFNWIASSRTANWTVSGLSIDSGLLAFPVDGYVDADRVTQLMALLDVRVRIGRELTVEGMPAYGPAGPVQSLYIEGGTYTWSGGRWLLDLTATGNALGGAAKIQDFTPEVTLQSFDPALRWVDIFGAGPLNEQVGFGAGPFGVGPRADA